MISFSSGVASYVVGEATVNVFFPVDFRGNADVRCDLCRFYSRSGRLCRLNGEIVSYPEKYIGSNCPLNFIEEDSNK